jgi:hypothetical protein
MARRPVAEVLTFRADDTQVVVDHMDRLGAAHQGWINFEPGVVEGEEPPPPTALGAMFSSNLHEVPICTWLAGKSGRHGVEPDQIGVQHGSGTRAVARLASLGVPLPDGWRWTQDHPRRGLVVRVPPGTGHRQQLTWLLEAATALTTVPLTGEWRARVRAGAGG